MCLHPVARTTWSNTALAYTANTLESTPVKKSSYVDPPFSTVFGVMMKLVPFLDSLQTLESLFMLSLHKYFLELDKQGSYFLKEISPK